MFNFGGIRHLIQYPSGRFGFVGSVPRELAYRDGKALAFDTVADALEASKAVAGTLCSIETCACRALFGVEVTK